MMTIKKKRKLNEDNTVDHQPVSKITKKDNISKSNELSNQICKKDVQFDVKHFRKEISTKTGQHVSLVQFLQASSHSNQQCLVQYLDSGGSANEILRQIDDESKKNPLVVSAVFGLLNLIIKQVGESHPQLLQQTEETCRFLLNSYISTIDFMLSEKSNAKQQKVTLQLLTMMVTLNVELAFTILNQLSLQPKTLVHLVKRQHSVKEKEDVRRGFILFLMSFFIENNTQLIKALLDKHGLIMLALPDLIHDKSDVVIMVLESLKKHIIYNQNISKTVKIRTFSPTFLANIFNLFNWKGENTKSEEGLKMKCEIEDCVFDFLLVLFTSHKNGIYFSDKYLATGDMLTNQFLWKTIESLESPWNNDKAGELLIKIVSMCPDLNKPILHLVENIFQPRHSEQWLKTITFLKTFYISLPPKHIISLMLEMSPTQITNFIRNVYLPLKILQTCGNTLSSSDIALKYDIISLLQIMLTSIKLFATEMDSQDGNFVKAKTLLNSRLEEFIPKHFPPTDLLITILHSVLDCKSDSDTTSDSTVKAPNNSCFVLCILDLLLTYNDILPNSLDPIATMLDSKRLLERVECIGGDHTDQLKLKIITFLLGADRFAFAPEKPLFKEILYSMLEVYTSVDKEISLSAKNVLRKILKTTRVFEKDLSEIDIVLSVMKIHHANQQVVVVQVVNVIISVLKHFINKIDARSIDMSAYKENYSFSPFVIGLLENKCVFSNFKDFFSECIISLYHNQHDPEDFAKILQDCDVDTSLKKYIISWQGQPQSLRGKIINKDSVLYKLSKGLLCDEQPLDVKDVFNISVCEENLIANTFVMQSQKFLFNPEHLTPYITLSTNLIMFYLVRQNCLDMLNEVKLHNCEQMMKCLLLMSKCESMKDKCLLPSIVEKCLTNKWMMKMFSPFCDNSPLTTYILDIVTFLFENNIESNLVSSLLKPYKREVYLAIVNKLRLSEKDKHGVCLRDVEKTLSVINLTLEDAQSILKELLRMPVTCMVTKENKISSWIFILCHIIKMFIAENRKLSHRSVQVISSLYCDLINKSDLILNLVDFEDCFHSYLQNNCDAIANVPHKVFNAIFSVKHINKTTSNLSSLLLNNDSSLLLALNKKICDSEVIKKRELIFPLLKVAFRHYNFYSNTNLYSGIYEFYKPNISKILEKPHKASQIYVDNSNVIVSLINRCMDLDECQKFCLKSLKYETLEPFHVNMLEEIFFKVYFAKNNVLCINNYLLCLIQLANVAFKKESVSTNTLAHVAKSIQKVILIIHNDQISTEKFSSFYTNTTFQTYFKNIIKFFVKLDNDPDKQIDFDCSIFNITSSLISAVFPSDCPSVEDMFDIVTSHSEFLNVMLSNHHVKVKTSLVKLLLVLVLNKPELAKSSHIPVYLSSYHASMSECDRYILYLLKLYEQNGLAINEFQPYLWGDIAANHYAVRSRRTNSSLWSHPTANHILNLLDKEMIEKTIKDFPMNASLNVEDTINKDVNFRFGIGSSEFVQIQDDILNMLYKKNHNMFYNSIDSNLNVVKSKLVVDSLVDTECTKRAFDLDHVYDPAFIIPLLNYVVSPGSVVSCHRIIRNGVLSIPFIALSSNCPLVRAGAFNTLHRFYTLLESEMYYKNDKIIWSQFIDTLKASLRSISMPGNALIPKLPTLAALYLSRSALVMTHPLDTMFQPINHFVISKQFIDLTVIPDFLDIFHNTDICFQERRTWLLKLLRDGVKLMIDIDVILKSFAFKMILDFYSSSLCDGKQKYLILEIVDSCIQIPKVAKLLTDGFSLFPWLSNVINDLNVENRRLVSISVSIVSNLWLSLSSETNKSVYTRLLNQNNNKAFIEVLTGKSLKINETLQTNFTYLLNELSPKLCNMSADDFRLYLNVADKLPKFKCK